MRPIQQVVTPLNEGPLSDELKDIQHWMQDAVMYPGRVDAQQVNAEVKGSSRLSPADSLAIYQRSYYARLLSCMREQFPALCYALGEAVFNPFAMEYLREYPSDSYTLHELGRRFPGYLSETRPDKQLEQKELWIEFMVELAAFERAVFTLFNAQGDEGLVLSQGHFDDSDLKLQRCLLLHQSRFPVARYYCLVRDEQAPPLPPLQDTYIVMVRTDYNTRLMRVSREQYQFLCLLQQHQSVERAINEMVDSALIQQQWGKPGGWKAQWLDAGFFVRA